MNKLTKEEKQKIHRDMLKYCTELNEDERSGVLDVMQAILDIAKHGNIHITEDDWYLVAKQYLHNEELINLIIAD